MEFVYTKDEEQKVHSDGVINLLCKAFQSHQEGLPEWVKNAADAYAREEDHRDISPYERVILIVTCDLARLGAPKIGCLDFVGTTSDRIEEHFRHWGSPEAAQGSGKHFIQGGHGNGGKCYMTQMFRDHSVFHTVKSSKGCRYGVKGGSTHFGYVPNASKGRDYDVKDTTKELDKILGDFNLSTNKLPGAAKESLRKSSGFTFVYGVGPRTYESKLRIKELLSQIRDHAQMQGTLEYCTVLAIHNGSLLKPFSPLKPSEIEPIPGYEEPRRIVIPESLTDPLEKLECSTTENGKYSQGTLDLLTSARSMRWKKKYRHSINYRSSTSGFFGFKSMLELDVRSAYRDQLYGTCTLDSLERFKQNDRRYLADSPLVRAVEAFIAKQVQSYAEEFEKRDKRKSDQEERNALSQMNDALNRWKNQFIADNISSIFGSGSGPSPRKPLPTGIPSRVEISLTHSRLGVGVAIQPRITFFDASNRRIRAVPYRWVTEDTNVALVDEEVMMINAFSPGQTVIYAESFDGKLTSNRVLIEVVRIRSISLDPPELTLQAGSRNQIRATCVLDDRTTASDVALIWTESDASIARVNTNGFIFGISPGSTEVVAGDDNAQSRNASKISVVQSEGAGAGGDGKGGKGDGRGHGGGYPLILVSGEIDKDPDTEEYVHFSPDDPPVWQRPQDTERNIWWINSAAPLAKHFLSQTAGYGYDSREWRMYHLERYIDILVEIIISADPHNDGPLSVIEYFQQKAGKSAELQAAIVEELLPFIEEGTFSLT